MQFNSYKAVLAFAGLAATTLLMITDSIVSEAGMPIITMIVGYAIGNGITASTGKPAEPIIKPKQKDVSN